MKHIQWFPGHMTKAMRMMEEQVKLVDGVLFVLDARAPLATRNPNLESLLGGKPVLYLLNKADLADEEKTAAFCARMDRAGEANVRCCATTSAAARQISGRIPSLLREKLARDAAKGITRPPRLMVVGIPNTGKSTVINALSGAKRAVTGDKAGVTRGKQWISVPGYELLDMPGVLWKKFDSLETATNLAFIGSIKDDILDIEELAMGLLSQIANMYPNRLCERYKLTEDQLALDAWDLLEAIGRKRGMLVSGGEVNTERAAIMVVDEFRASKWGRISLEKPAREVPEDA